MSERSYDLLIRHARLRGRDEKLFDIGIAAGCVKAIERRVEGTAKEEIDAEGNLTTESFVNSTCIYVKSGLWKKWMMSPCVIIMERAWAKR